MIDWNAEVDGWTEFLRDHLFPLSVADHLRIHALLDRLRELSVPLSEAAAVARWVGPVICRNEDDQKRLPGLLLAWEATRTGTVLADLPPTDALEAAKRALTRETKTRNRIRILVGLVAVIVVGAVLALTFWGQAREITPPGSQPRAAAASDDQDGASSVYAPRYAIGISTLAPFLVTIVILRRRRDTAAALLRGLAPRDAPSEALKLGIADYALFRFEAMRGALADLRRHRYVPAPWLDGRRSVAATVAAAGRVQLVAGIRPVVPEYLLLVDLAGSGDILGAVADLLGHTLSEGDVKFERFDFQGDPRRLLRILDSGAAPDCFDLEWLRATYPEHRVLVLSDAASFTDTEGQGVRSWVEQLRAWPEVSILTPLPASQWGPRERTLLRLGFDLSPATPGGIGDLAKRIRTALPPTVGAQGASVSQRFDRRFAADPYTWLGEATPSPAQVSAIVEDLREVLGPRALLYLEALAVFPLLHPKLTLAFGRLLGDGSGIRILDEDTLSLLSRVPWMRRGRLPNWLRLALVRDLQTRPVEADRVRDAWSVLLAPPARDSPGDLPVEVVRAVTPELPQLVASLIKRQTRYREAILIAFLDRRELPELAVELPGYRPTKRWIASVPNELILAVAGIAVSSFALFDLGAISNAVNRLVFDVINPQQGSSLVFHVLPGIGLAAGILTLMAWYARELSAVTTPAWLRLRIPVEVSESLIRASGLVCFTAYCLHAWLQGETDQRLGEALSRVVLSGILLCWCWNTRGERVLAWAPPLILLTLSIKTPDPTLNGRAFPVEFFDPVVVPMVIWLSTRHEPQRLFKLLRYVGAASIFSMPLTRSVYLESNIAGVAALMTLSRFIADGAFRWRCLNASELGWRSGLLLALPLSISVSMKATNVTSLDWYPTLLLCLIFGLFGWASPRYRGTVAGYGVATLALATANVFDWPIDWMQWKVVDHPLLGMQITAYPLISWSDAFTTLLASYLSGALLAHWGEARLRAPQRALLLAGFVLASVAVAFRLEIHSPNHSGSVSDAMILPYGAMMVAGSCGLLLGRRILVPLITVSGILLTVVGAIWLDHSGRYPAFAHYFPDEGLSFGIFSVQTGSWNDVATASAALAAIALLLSRTPRTTVEYFFHVRREGRIRPGATSTRQPVRLPLLVVGRWQWPAVVSAVLVLGAVYGKEIIRVLNQRTVTPTLRQAPMEQLSHVGSSVDTSGGTDLSGGDNSTGGDFSGPRQEEPAPNRPLPTPRKRK